MAMTMKDDDGNVLWDPSDFGDYSMEKIQAIANILKVLLSDTTIKMETLLDDGTYANVYTKEQSDEKYFTRADTDIVIVPIVRSKVDDYLSSTGNAVTKEEFNNIKMILNTIRIACMGLDLDSNAVNEAMSLSRRVSALDDSTNGRVISNYNLIMKLLTAVCEVDGTSVNPDRPRVAYAADTGQLSDLSTGISDRTTLVRAINSLYSALVSIRTRVSDVESDVTVIKGSVETNKDNITALDTDLTRVETEVTSVGTDLSELDTKVETYRKDSEVDSEKLSTLETFIGDKELSDYTGLSIVESLNSISNSLKEIDERLSAIESKSTT